MTKSHIEQTEMTQNPINGCNKVSAGCKFCYAERMSKRLKAMGQAKYQNGFKITHPEALKVPFTQKPQLVFVSLFSDTNALKEVFQKGAVRRFAPKGA